MTDHKRTVINAALRASTHRIVRLFGFAWRHRDPGRGVRTRRVEGQTRQKAGPQAQGRGRHSAPGLASEVVSGGGPMTRFTAVALANEKAGQ
jgi:hypothetical protein